MGAPLGTALVASVDAVEELIPARGSVLDLSVRMIDLGDIDAEDRLDPERVYVWGRSGGPVDWWVETRATWLSVTRVADYFEISFAPQPGRNHATVWVNDSANGEVHIVWVQLRRRQPSADQPATPATSPVEYVTPVVRRLAMYLGVDLSTRHRHRRRRPDQEGRRPRRRASLSPRLPSPCAA